MWSPTLKTKTKNRFEFLVVTPLYFDEVSLSRFTEDFLDIVLEEGNCMI